MPAKFYLVVFAYGEGTATQHATSAKWVAIHKWGVPVDLGYSTIYFRRKSMTSVYIPMDTKLPKQSRSYVEEREPEDVRVYVECGYEDNSEILDIYFKENKARVL